MKKDLANSKVSDYDFGAFQNWITHIGFRIPLDNYKRANEDARLALQGLIASFFIGISVSALNIMAWCMEGRKARRSSCAVMRIHASCHPFEFRISDWWYTSLTRDLSMKNTIPSTVILNNGQPFELSKILELEDNFPVISLKTAAIKLGVSFKTVYALIEDGSLPAVALPRYGEKSRQRLLYINLHALREACEEAVKHNPISVTATA